MAKLKLYQIRDIQAGLVGGVIMAYRNPGPAIRDFHSLLANKDTQPGRYPADFNLLYLGEQDDETGQLTAMERPEIIATGSAWAAGHSDETGDPARSGAATPLAGEVRAMLDRMRDNGPDARFHGVTHGEDRR